MGHHSSRFPFFSRALFPFVFALAAACSSTTTTGGSSGTSGTSGTSGGSGTSGTSGGASSCANIAGTWSVGGSCGSDTCTITQHDCATSFSCSGGTVSYTGEVVGQTATFTGRNAAGVQGTCTVTVDAADAAMSGSCQPQGLAVCGVTVVKK